MGPGAGVGGCPAHCSYPCCSSEDVAMRTYDFSPLWRSSIGFDRVFDLLNSSRGSEGADYPPYNIQRTGEETYRITLAVAGFAPEQISITAQQNELTVSAQRADEPDHQYLHKGIAARPFQQTFSLEDHVEVEGASFENGLLQIDLLRRVPETMKPRSIEIGTGKTEGKLAKGKTVEHMKQAS
jgi:molecular chaperone IbpA